MTPKTAAQIKDKIDQRVAAQINGPQVGQVDDTAYRLTRKGFDECLARKDEVIIVTAQERDAARAEALSAQKRIAELLALIGRMEDYLGHMPVCRGRVHSLETHKNKWCDCGLTELRQAIEKTRGQ